MATFAELVSSFDNDAGKRGKQFEHFVKWFLQNDPEWGTQVDQVWLWEEYPDRWGIDCGIDLVFRHKNGEAWAVQAKCYSQQHDITKHDVDKFLSESNRKGIDRRLLIATTDRIGANAKQVCEAQEKSVFRYLLSNFESANIEYPATLADLHSAKKKPKPTPREHQLEAIDGVVTSFNATDRGQLIMACGTGKTFTTLWIKEKLEATSTLILLPSLGLLSQTLHEWTLAANQPFEVLCVCSDDTVGKKGTDEAIHSITDVAFPVTSNVDEIRKFLCRDGAKVVFSTYQSSPLVAEAQSVATVPDFDLAIADEAHRCAGKVGNDFTTILDAKLVRARKRLFATATPRTYSTNVKKAAGERGIDVVGMDDEVVFGTVSYSLPFGEAIKRGLLTDYQVVIIGVDNPTIAAWIENRELVKTESGIESDAESLAAQIGLLKAYKDYDLRRVISFHSRVKRAEQFSKDLIDVIGWVGDKHKPSGTMKTDFVSGEMPTDKRRIKLAQLKSLAPQERGLLTNARCLSEGVDVPSLDGVAFIDPRSSQIDIIQAVGRAIRLSINKTAGTIILPVFIEAGIDSAASIEESNFKPIWDVLNALKAHDDVLSAELDQLRIEMGHKGGSSIDPMALAKIHIDLPASVDQSFGGALRTQLVERVTVSWDYCFGLLQRYADVNGDSLVPAQFRSEGNGLGMWVVKQRGDRSVLSSERMVRLESLPGWTWDPRKDAWDKGFKYLEEFWQENGHCRFTGAYVNKAGFRLGGWVAEQRSTRATLSVDRIQRLESLSGWSWRVLDDAWEEGFSHLQKYCEINGHGRVPASHLTETGIRLGCWVSKQRMSRGMLSQDRLLRLEALQGWSWDPRTEAWEDGFRRLSLYIAEHGESNVKNSYKTTDGYRLGGWIAEQKSTREKLLPERVARLEALSGWTWNKRDEAWENGFQHLEEYCSSNGDCVVPTPYVSPDGYRLGQWVGVQRSTKGLLPQEKVSRLDSLMAWTWEARRDAWESKFGQLSEYCEVFGTSTVPLKYVAPNGFALGSWVRSQRARKDTHSSETSARFDALPGWSWNLVADKWESSFSELSKYAATEGNCLVAAGYKSPDGYSLGVWVCGQRANRESLNGEQQARLEALPGWSWYPLEDGWEEGFRHLQEYSTAHGDSIVPQRYKTAEGFALGVWVAHQRDRHREQGLSVELQARLESLPIWSWNPRAEAWEIGFSELQDYAASKGNCLVKTSYRSPSGYGLGDWARRQHEKQKTLSSEMRARLEALPGWTWKVKE